MQTRGTSGQNRFYPTSLLTPGRGLGVALLLLVACERGSGAPQLWLHDEGEGHSRVVLTTADGTFLREWRVAGVLDEKTGNAVRVALSPIARPAHAVDLKVQKSVKFGTLKALMLATGSPDSRGYDLDVQVIDEFPAQIMANNRARR
jgi:hypothetical protein